VERLAEAIEILIHDPRLRLEMGKAGREFVEREYVWKDNLAAMKNLYEKILGERTE
jgi:glycosyltransferase involved in cell wall biosynthesis